MKELQPNFLIIMSDQHAANAVGALGHSAVIARGPWLPDFISRMFHTKLATPILNGMPTLMYQCPIFPLGGEESYRDILIEVEQAARADGWDPISRESEIRLHKRRISYIHEAETGF